MKRLLTFVLLISIIISCKEELSLREQSYLHCRDNMEFKCTEPLGEYYFKGKINGKEFCVSDEKNGYARYNTTGVGYVTPTSNPTLDPANATPIATFYNIGFIAPIMDNINGLPEEFTPAVNITTPYIKDTTLYPSIEYFKRFIKLGDLNLMSKEKDQADAFNITMTWGCVWLPGYEHYLKKDPYRIPAIGVGLTPATGGEQEDAVFKITELNKVETEELIIYDLTFEIDCDLYFWDSKDNYRYYGRLEDGTLKTQVVIPNDDDE